MEVKYIVFGQHEVLSADFKSQRNGFRNKEHTHALSLYAYHI